MKSFNKRRFNYCFLPVFCTLFYNFLYAQTDLDAIMMKKKNFCVGMMYSNSSWTNYWEGTYKRDNENLGKVSTQMLGVMANYGISEKLNLIAGAPYVTTKASGGTLHGMKGIQDLSLWLKWKALKKHVGSGTFSLFGVGGFSFPLSDYTPDFLPLSIGFHSRVLTARLIADYQISSFFATVSGSYNYRSNITLDRTSYYTTNIHLTNKVEMPDVASFNFRTGYRRKQFIAEAVLGNMITLNGFDIRKNDMPFPSNKMNAMTAGLNLRYNLKWLPRLLLTAGGNYVLTGRNVGQAATVEGGAFYVMDFSKKNTSTYKAF